MICRGNSRDDLMGMLSELDRLRSVETILTENDEIHVTLKRHNGRITEWSADSDMGSLSQSAPVIKGTGIDSLADSIRDYDTDLLSSSYVVLAHYGTELKKSRDGKIRSKWYFIDPYLSIEEGDGMAMIRLKELVLNPEDYRAMMEMELALYDCETELLYPFKRCAVSNLGKLLDCEMAFHVECPLGAAVILAERLSYENHFCLMHRKKTGQVRPVMAVTSPKYQWKPQKPFFMDVISMIQEKCFCEVVSWEIYEEEVVAEIHLKDSCQGPAVNGFFIRAGEIPGYPMTATAFKKIGSSYIYLKEKSLWHKKEDGNVSCLFYKMWSCFSEFDRYFEMISGIMVENPVSIMEKYLYPVIGKKRWEKIKMEFADFSWNGSDFYRKMLSVTDFRFSRKSERRTKLLRFSYFDILKEICQKQAKKAKNSERKKIDRMPIHYHMDEEGQYCLMDMQQMKNNENVPIQEIQ